MFLSDVMLDEVPFKECSTLDAHQMRIQDGILFPQMHFIIINTILTKDLFKKKIR
jgi:hypothetical protein